MQSDTIKYENPIQFLKRLELKKIRILTKWGFYYEGILQETDKYFNLLVVDCVEFNNDIKIKLGKTLIRCNNVKLIQELFDE